MPWQDTLHRLYNLADLPIIFIRMLSHFVTTEPWSFVWMKNAGFVLAKTAYCKAVTVKAH